MDFDKFYRLLAAPLAAVFLLLAVVLVIERPKKAVGEEVWLLNYLNRIPQGPCDPIQVRQGSDGRTWINWMEVPSSHIVETLSRVEEYSPDRTIYITIDAGVSNESAMKFIDSVAHASTDLNIVLVTPQNYRDSGNYSENHTHGIACNLDLPVR